MNIVSYLPFAGRLMIGLPFAMSGLSKLGTYSATTGMIGAVGLPFPPLAFAVAVVIELGGGLLLIVGHRAATLPLLLPCSRSQRQCRFTTTLPTRTR
jgi:putative oxidoreductase